MPAAGSYLTWAVAEQIDVLNGLSVSPHLVISARPSVRLLRDEDQSEPAGVDGGGRQRAETPSMGAWLIGR